MLTAINIDNELKNTLSFYPSNQEAATKSALLALETLLLEPEVADLSEVTVNQAEETDSLKRARSIAESLLFLSAEEPIELPSMPKKAKIDLFAAVDTGNMAALQNIEVADLIAFNEAGSTLLIHAAKIGALQIVELLLERGADLELSDKQGLTALNYAALNGHRDLVEFLLDSMGEAQAMIELAAGYSLHCATTNGHLNVVQLLLDRDAYVDTKLKGFTALHCAAANGHVNIAELLLKKGAKIYLTNLKGHTALHLAAFKNHGEVCKVLIGCLKHIPDDDTIKKSIERLFALFCCKKSKPNALLSDVELRKDAANILLFKINKNSKIDPATFICHEGIVRCAAEQIYSLHNSYFKMIGDSLPADHPLKEFFAPENLLDIIFAALAKRMPPIRYVIPKMVRTTI